MISSDVLRGYNDTIVLYFLLDEPSYGYEIIKRIKETSNGIYVMKATTLYSVCTRLEKNGYVTSFFGNEPIGTRRKYYQITAKGISCYYDKCREWDLTKDVIEKFIRREKGDE